MPDGKEGGIIERSMIFSFAQISFAGLGYKVALGGYKPRESEAHSVPATRVSTT